MATTPRRTHEPWAYAAAHAALMDAQARQTSAALTAAEALARLHTLEWEIERLKAPTQLDRFIAALQGTLTRLQAQQEHLAADLKLAHAALTMPEDRTP